ncbi:hypothetical protein [Methanobacterium petrolearium]
MPKCNECKFYESVDEKKETVLERKYLEIWILINVQLTLSDQND